MAATDTMDAVVETWTNTGDTMDTQVAGATTEIMEADKENRVMQTLVWGAIAGILIDKTGRLMKNWKNPQQVRKVFEIQSHNAHFMIYHMVNLGTKLYFANLN